jgi:hypothetical protein
MEHGRQRDFLSEVCWYVGGSIQVRQGRRPFARRRRIPVDRSTVAWLMRGMVLVTQFVAHPKDGPLSGPDC